MIDQQDKPRGQRGKGCIYQRANGTWCSCIGTGYKNGKRLRQWIYGKTKGDVEKKVASFKLRRLAASLKHEQALELNRLNDRVDALETAVKYLTSIIDNS